MPIQNLSLEAKSYPLRVAFTISRVSKKEAEPIELVVDYVDESGLQSKIRTEALPYRHFGENPEALVEEFNQHKILWQGNFNRFYLNQNLKPGALRNVLDTACWMIEAQKSRKTLMEYMGVQVAKPIHCPTTIVLDSLDNMVKAAESCQNYQYLKVKLNDQAVVEKMSALARVCPDASFIVDPNESWTIAQLNEFSLLLKQAGVKVEMIEQPLKAGLDEQLLKYNRLFPLASDESCHDVQSYQKIKDYYEIVNIKLDKTGGLTEALALMDHARQDHKKVMIGCMVASSLSMYPAFCLAQKADYADLDGAWFLANDPYNLIHYDNSGIVSQRNKE